MKHRNDDRQPSLFDAMPAYDDGHEGTAKVQEPEGEYRLGYKKVKQIGWVPEDWGVDRLGKHLSLSSGKTKPDDIQEGRTKTQNVPVYGGNGVMGYSAQPLASGPRVVIGRVGAHCGIVHHVSGDYWVTDNAMYTHEFGDPREAKYFYYLLHHLKLGRLRSAGAQPLISQRPVLRRKVAVPPPSERCKIAHILDTWDEALAQFDALIAAKEQRLKGLAQRLLTGEEQLPEYADPPRREVKLGDVTRELRKRNKGMHREDRLYGVDKFKGMIPNRDRVQSDDISNYKVVPPKAFAYNPMRLNIGSIARLEEPFPVLVSPDYIVFECKSGEMDPDYLNHYRQGYRWAKFVERAGSGSVRVRIYYQHLRRMKLTIPSFAEQRRIAEVLNAASYEIDLIRQERDALAKQKMGLMQRLLTGEVRVTPDPEDLDNQTP